MPFRSIWPTGTLVKTASCKKPYRIWDQSLLTVRINTRTQVKVIGVPVR